MNRNRIVYIAIFVFCLLIGIKTAIDTPLGLDTLTFELKSSHGGDTELFYDQGEGFAPDLRITNQVTVENEFTDLVFELPQVPLIRLRWDPVYHEEGVDTVVRSIRLSYYGGEAEFEIPFESLVPKNDVRTFEIADDSFSFKVVTGESDPFIHLTKVPPAPAKPSRPWLLVKGLGYSILAALLLCAFYRLVTRYFEG